MAADPAPGLSAPREKARIVYSSRRVDLLLRPPVVLEVASGRMARDGHVFFVTDNAVWLTEAVPVEHLLPW